MDLLAAYESWTAGLPAAMFDRRDGAINQALKFTNRQVYVQRVLAISASTTSIVFCLAALYSFGAIDPRRIVFRHHLIFFLIVYDFIKAVILLLYPVRVLTTDSAYYNNEFCQVVGFFTATSVEGADLAILAFAVHTFLLIFKTSFTVRLTSGRTEGGLYLYRKYVYVASVLIPLVLASLAYVKGNGYNSYVCWCSLPQRPVWYRLVLSWLPRYIIIVTILVVYVMIYFHVIREFKTLGGVFKTMKRGQIDDKPTFFSALRYSMRSLFNYLMVELVFPDKNIQSEGNTRSPRSSSPNENSIGINKNELVKQLSRQSVSIQRQFSEKVSNENNRGDQELDDDDDVVHDHGSPTGLGSSSSSSDNCIKPDLYEENLANFRKRQKIIEKQMKSIFIYPLAYIFLWLFPFILYVTQINYEQTHAPIYWLNCMGAFMQPLNGFVDSLVFFYREIPTEYTIMKNFEKQHGHTMANLVHVSQDSDSIATSAILNKQSVSISLAQDLSEYSKWRQWLHWLRFPLYELPSENNVAKIHDKYMNHAIRSQSSGHRSGSGVAGGTNSIVAGSNHSNTKHRVQDGGGPSSGGLQPFGHDFSNVLSGNVPEKEYRTNLDQFSMNFSHRVSVTSSGSKRTSRSGKTRQQSIIDPNVIVEGEVYSRQPSTSTSVALNTPKKTNPTSGRSSATLTDDDDMDFMEFLQKGPG
ncbi:hypothetical protein CAAN3_04S02014 [[Candida] anglica]